MFDSLKRLWLIPILLLAGSPAVFAFALLGPFNEVWQVPDAGYNLTLPASAFGNDGGQAVSPDIGAPKNFGQGYRLNTPTNYYAYDASFLRYFGSNGVVAVDEAFAVFNNLDNVSDIDLTQWPFKSSRVNYRAQALQMIDLKSYAMSMLIEQLGLAQPDRWTWCLHDHYLPPGANCPAYEYLIVQRNFDPFTTEYSPYVNGVLYGYQIEELCGLTPVNPFAPLGAEAVEIQVDPSQQADSGSAVAAYGSAFTYGTFFTSLTQDDVGGLKALYAATNVYVESSESNSLQVLTNPTNQLLVTSDYGLFLLQSLTNDAAALQLLYPNLIITSETPFFTNVVTTNVVGVITAPPNAPIGTLIVTLVTNRITNVQEVFLHTFANVYTNRVYSKGFVTTQTTSFTAPPNAPAGTLVFTTNSTTKLVNFTNGDFYILPTNLCGPYEIVSTQLISVSSNITTIPILTNIFVTNGTFFTANLITYVTNYSFVVHETDCVTNSAALRGGMEKVRFIRQDFDSLLGQTWSPITNTYQLTAITNGVPFVQTFRRVITQPDFIISAADLANGPAQPLFGPPGFRNPPKYDTNQIPFAGVGSIGGPGTIQPYQTNLVFNSVGPISFNAGPFFSFSDTTVGFAETNSAFIFQWGSFDGSTNTPIVYPTNSSIASLEAQIFFQITTGLLPEGSASSTNAYSVQLEALGGSPATSGSPYKWALSSDSAALPNGLTLTASGLISGRPKVPGTYDFTVQATDIGLRSAQKALFITVDP